MNNNTLEIIKIRLEATKKALESHHFETHIVKDKEEAKHLVNTLIKDGDKVSDGGSMSLSETGISKMLEARDVSYISHNDPTLTKEELASEARAAFSADTFIMSSNAITMDGELVNVDGSGNRVAALIYGPKQVLVIAGYNKVVKDLREADDRIRRMAAPANCVRLKKQTPCSKLGECKDCFSDDRICCSHVVLNYQKTNRIKVILVEEELGY